MAHSGEVRFDCADLVLAGTVHWPTGRGPHPAVIMLQGSGATDRDSEGYFPPIRDHFLAHGLAVLSWDKPGIGGSTGQWTRQTFFDRADEALAAIAWLGEQETIDPARVGIWGHSQGGWIGPLTASRSPDLAFLIVNSGPGVTAHEQDLFGIEHTLRGGAATAEEIARARAFMQSVHDAALQAASYDELATRILEPARGTPWYDYFGEVDPELWRFFVINAGRPYDPVATLERITCPILAIFGELDPLVPVAESVRVFAASRATAADRDVTIRVFPGANHRIRVGDPTGFAPGYLETMTDWISDRIRLTS